MIVCRAVVDGLLWPVVSWHQWRLDSTCRQTEARSSGGTENQSVKRGASSRHRRRTLSTMCSRYASSVVPFLRQVSRQGHKLSHLFIILQHYYIIAAYSVSRLSRLYSGILILVVV